MYRFVLVLSRDAFFFPGLDGHKGHFAVIMNTILNELSFLNFLLSEFKAVKIEQLAALLERHSAEEIRELDWVQFLLHVRDVPEHEFIMFAVLQEGGRDILLLHGQQMLEDGADPEILQR